jgi:hypothetical protein
MTFDALRAMNYSKERSDLISHYASVFADNPGRTVKGFFVLKYNRLSYRDDINYAATANSQSETEVVPNIWHSMRTNAEAISAEDAMKRGIKFGWDKIFESAKYGRLEDLEINSVGMEALGQGLHALQDALAHKGASWAEHDLNNDIYGDLTATKQITRSALIVHKILNKDFSNFEKDDVSKIDMSGMSNDQKQQVLDSVKDFFDKKK